jgi:murein DD-endopeptidase MepM/ murein hydrolase activator NlpD
MMNFKLKYHITFIVVFWNVLAFAQFNTLTRTSIKKEEGFAPKEEIQKVEISKPEKESNRIINFFGRPKKVDLKSEVDSLKNLVLKYSLSKNKAQTINYKKIEDSIIQMMKRNVENSDGKNIQKSIQKFDFKNDEESNLISKISMPLKNGITVTSPFGSRIHPLFGISKMHNGADLKANYENVYSVLDGVVSDEGWDYKGGGNYIKIKNSNSFTTSFLHLSQIYYKVGEYVKAGYIIAKSGNSGNSTGPHLHFSVKENGNFINPIRFLSDLIKTNNLIATYYEK